MAKYENIRALAKKQLQAVTESSDRWKAFLQTAAMNALQAQAEELAMQQIYSL